MDPQPSRFGKNMLCIFFCVSCGNFKNSLRFNLLDKETERLRCDKFQKYLQKHPPLFALGGSVPKERADRQIGGRRTSGARTAQGAWTVADLTNRFGRRPLKGVMLRFCIIDYFILSYVVFNSTNGTWVVWVGGLGF